jgi:hypothetical protein
LTAINTGSLTGLRYHALIGVMIYTFARIGAVLQMNVADHFTQGRRGWVRLHEKGGKEYEAPCHHKLETYLDEYTAGILLARFSKIHRAIRNRPAMLNIGSYLATLFGREPALRSKSDRMVHFQTKGYCGSHRRKTVTPLPTAEFKVAT